MAVELGNGAVVACLDNNGDGTVTLRLAPGPDGPRAATLREPTARDYAELRTAMVAADDEVAAKFPPPVRPVITDEMDGVERARVAADWAEAVQAFNRDQRNYVRSLDTAPYLPVIVEVVRRLAGLDVGADDLTAEAFNPTLCQALLEVWEAPLGGPGAPAPSAAPAPATAGPAGSAPASPEPAPSSPPGGEPSPPSPQEPSTA